MTKTNKKALFALGASALVATFAVTTPALAESGPNLSKGSGEGRGEMRLFRGGDDKRDESAKPSVIGKITAISGSTITVQGTTEFGKDKDNSETSYTVNASGATVRKGNAASSLSSLAVGDTVMIQGTVSGTNVTATAINAGMMFKGVKDKDSASSTPVFTGNGQPVIAGKVTAISGSTVTVTTATNISYSVDAANAKVLSGKEASSVSALAVGSEVVVQGTVNGTSVTASSVIAGKAGTSPDGKAHKGFFRGIGHFFASIFGF